MNFKYSHVSISEIALTSELYKISIQTETGDLEKSITTIGLINGPILIKKKSAFFIVCGFRRILALKKMGQTEIPVRLLGSDTTDLDCLKISISDNSFQRALSIQEQSISINKLACYITDNNKFNETVFNTLNIPPNPSFIRKIKVLETFNDEFKSLIFDDKLSFSLVGYLTQFSEKALLALIPYFQNMKLSLSKQREFLTLLFEISKRESTPIDILLETSFLKNILEDKDLERNQKAAQIKGYLKKRRYPHLTKIEDHYEKLVKDLKLSKNTSIIPPKNFEGNTFSIKMDFQNFSELVKKKDDFEKIVHHPTMKKISDKEIY